MSKQTLTSDHASHEQRLQSNLSRYRPGTFLHSAGEAQSTAPLRFPGKMTPYEPADDTRMSIKRTLINNGKPFGEVFQEPEDINWVKRKMENFRELQDYKLYVDQYDLTDPAQLRIAQEGCPQFFNALEKQLELDAELQLRLGKIAIRGQQGWDDFVLLSQILRGEIDLPTGPLWNPTPITDNDMATYEYGLFNPRINKLPIGANLGTGTADAKRKLDFLGYLTYNLIKQGADNKTRLNLRSLPEDKWLYTDFKGAQNANAVAPFGGYQGQQSGAGGIVATNNDLVGRRPATNGTLG